MGDILQKAEPGCLDDVLLLILPLLDKDLFGDVADAKENSAFAAPYKEVKKCRAYDTYRLLAGIITFRTHIAVLMNTVRFILDDRDGLTMRIACWMCWLPCWFAVGSLNLCRCRTCSDHWCSVCMMQYVCRWR